jgi:hypothetical protein
VTDLSADEGLVLADSLRRIVARPEAEGGATAVAVGRPSAAASTGG